MLFFSILAGISPFLVAFLEDKFKISWSSVSIVNFGDLIAGLVVEIIYKTESIFFCR